MKRLDLNTSITESLNRQIILVRTQIPRSPTTLSDSASNIVDETLRLVGYYENRVSYLLRAPLPGDSGCLLNSKEQVLYQLPIGANEVGQDAEDADLKAY